MKKPQSNTKPYVPYGPATGVQQPDNIKPNVQPGDYYTGVHPPKGRKAKDHAEGGPGHADCDHD